MSYTVSRLADLSSLITKGTTPTTLGFDFAESGIPFLRAQNLREGRVDVDADPMYIPHETHRALARSRVVTGDILLSIAGTIGRAALVDERWPEMNCNQAVSIIRPTDQIVPRYLLHWLASENAINQIRRSEVTATISNLSLSQVGNLRIAVPPLDEQRRIAAILDQADDLRHKRRAALRQLDKILAVQFVALFGDPETNPKGLAKRSIEELLAVSPNFGSMIPPSKTGGDWLSLRVANIQDWDLDLTDAKYIALSAKDVARHSLADSDLILARAIASEEHLGKCVVVNRATEQICCVCCRDGQAQGLAPHPSC